MGLEWAVPIVGSVISGLFGGSNQASVNAMNAQIAREQMEFQERMSNTAHQREVADLRAAGLNPILSAGGSGSSTPSGSSATMHAYDPSQAIMSGVNSAMKLKEVDQKLVANTIRKSDQDILESKARSESLSAGLLKTAEEIRTMQSQQLVNAETVKKLGADTTNALLMNDVYRKQPELLAAQIGSYNAAAGLASANSAVAYKNVAVLEQQAAHITEQIKAMQAQYPKRDLEASFWDYFRSNPRQQPSPAGRDFFDNLDDTLRRWQHRLNNE